MMNNAKQPLGCRQCGAVKFVHAFLPDAKKPYNLKAVHQPELDVHGIASKAVVPPGLTVGTAYTMRVVTQSSAKHSGALLKEVRVMNSEFTLTPHS